MAQPTRQATNIPQIAGLFVFVATAAIFGGALVNAVLAGLGTVQEYAVAFSYLVGIVALVAMFVDIYDLWFRGRSFSPGGARGLRMVVLVAILGSMAVTLLGKNMALVIFFMPAVLIYYMTMRPRPATSHGASSGRARTPSATSSTASRARQRRGGRKRR